MRFGCISSGGGAPGDKVFARSSDAFMAVRERERKFLSWGRRTDRRQCRSARDDGG
jgi:hypothetical protein